MLDGGGADFAGDLAGLAALARLFFFGFTIILVAPGVTIPPPEITRRAVTRCPPVLSGVSRVKFCLRRQGKAPIELRGRPLPSAGLYALTPGVV